MATAFHDSLGSESLGYRKAKNPLDSKKTLFRRQSRRNTWPWRRLGAGYLLSAIALSTVCIKSRPRETSLLVRCYTCDPKSIPETRNVQEMYSRLSLSLCYASGPVLHAIRSRENVENFSPACQAMSKMTSVFHSLVAWKTMKQ